MTTPHHLSILVAGCSTAFGRQSAIALARRGHRIIAGVRERTGRGAEHAAELAALARAESLDLRVVDLDVDREETIEAAVEAAKAYSFGRLDALVNSAAYSVLGPLEACPPEQLLALLNTNVVGALRLFRAVLPVMREAGNGRIVQITSGLGRAVLPFMGPFAATAWALESFAEVLAMEAAPFGVKVALVEPSGYREGDQPRKSVGDLDRLMAYESQLISMAERMQSNGGQGEDAAEVAEAVVSVVEAETVPLRTPVGQAATELLELRERLTFAEYEREILRRAGLT
jgi:NAD(P)-dependent dehydrogenase (short-subunit alcohol dehydrogenase family)